MTARLVDTATLENTDWSFLVQTDFEKWRREMVGDLWGEAEEGVALPIEWDPEPEVLEAIRKRTDWVATRYEVSKGDLFQDVLIGMAVRPHETQGIETGVLLHRAEMDAIDLARPGAKRNAREVSYEEHFGGEQWLESY